MTVPIGVAVTTAALLASMAAPVQAGEVPSGAESVPLELAASVILNPTQLSLSSAPLIPDEEVGSNVSSALTYGPSTPTSIASGGPTSVADSRYDSFGERVGAVAWEAGAIAAVLTATNLGKVIREPQSFRFQDEGLFGRDTNNLGVDKLAHSYNTYLFSEILYRRMKRKTGGGVASAVTAAALGAGLQFYGEVYDGLHEGSGFSLQDTAFNLMGAGFSVLRNSVPQVRETVDFRLLIVPNSDIYTANGKRHFEQQKFFLAFKPAGFDALKRTPLRLLELHVGYSARDFTNEDRAAGVRSHRAVFLGAGVNFTQLFFRNARTPLAKAAATVLEYYQLPYTSVRTD